VNATHCAELAELLSYHLGRCGELTDSRKVRDRLDHAYHAGVVDGMRQAVEALTGDGDAWARVEQMVDGDEVEEG
jgi:hypothetical protein